MKKLSLRGGQGHVRVPSPFFVFFDGMSGKQRRSAEECAQRVADHVVHLRKPQRVAVLGILNPRTENASNKRCEDDPDPAMPFLRQRIGQRQSQREEEKYIHQHLAVEFWLLECGGKCGKGRKDGLVVARCAG